MNEKEKRLEDIQTRLDDGISWLADTRDLLSFLAAKDWEIARWKARVEELEVDYSRACGQILTLRQFIQEIHIGRLFCQECNEWDYRCGCEINIRDRYRKGILIEMDEIANGKRCAALEDEKPDGIPS